MTTQRGPRRSWEWERDPRVWSRSPSVVILNSPTHFIGETSQFLTESSIIPFMISSLSKKSSRSSAAATVSMFAQTGVCEGPNPPNPLAPRLTLRSQSYRPSLFLDSANTAANTQNLLSFFSPFVPPSIRPSCCSSSLLHPVPKPGSTIQPIDGLQEGKLTS